MASNVEDKKNLLVPLPHNFSVTIEEKEEKYVLRPLELNDFKKGFKELLAQLSDPGDLDEDKYITIWKKNKFMGSESTERRREMFSKSEIDDIFASHHVIRMQQDERFDDYREEDVLSLAMFDFAIENTRT